MKEEFIEDKGGKKNKQRSNEGNKQKHYRLITMSFKQHAENYRK